MATVPNAISIKKAAELMGCSKQHIETLCREHLFIVYDISRKPGSCKRHRYSIDSKSFSEFIRSRRADFSQKDFGICDQKIA